MCGGTAARLFFVSDTMPSCMGRSATEISPSLRKCSKDQNLSTVGPLFKDYIRQQIQQKWHNARETRGTKDCGYSEFRSFCNLRQLQSFVPLFFLALIINLLKFRFLKTFLLSYKRVVLGDGFTYMTLSKGTVLEKLS